MQPQRVVMFRERLLNFLDEFDTTQLPWHASAKSSERIERLIFVYIGDMELNHRHRGALEELSIANNSCKTLYTLKRFDIFTTYSQFCKRILGLLV